MINPVRPEVKDAIVQCNQSGITAIMSTGDLVDTAVAIARELGILTEGKKAITGVQLSAMSDEEFAAEMKNIAVYARVQPEHKTRIVNGKRPAQYRACQQVLQVFLRIPSGCPLAMHCFIWCSVIHCSPSAAG